MALGIVADGEGRRVHRGRACRNRRQLASRRRCSIVGRVNKESAIMNVCRSIAAAAALVLAAAPACAQDPKADAPATPATQVFQLPEGARVHDVAPAPDGTIWYTAQRQGA